MWLLDTKDHHLQEFIGDDVPPYAILSHTWADEEVTFKDMSDLDDRAKKRKGWSKLSACCRQALDDGYKWVWIDTCCIDKSSSAELSEAINSMWRYYEMSEICYAFLADVAIPSGLKPSGKTFTDGDPGHEHGRTDIRSVMSMCRWFTRGWTLQELLAPKRVLFLSQDWSPIGYRDDLVGVIESITGVSRRYIGGNVNSASVACRMSWASKRKTTRSEDIAYCLLGLFQINMPLLYGEGTRAFKRLQLEIIRNTVDQSIFVWKCDTNSPSHQAGEAQGILAESPSWFGDSRSVQVDTQENGKFSPSNVTNAGILIRLQMGPIPPLTYPSVHRYGGSADLRMIALSCFAPEKSSMYGQVGICVRINGQSIERDVPRKGLEYGDPINSAVRAFPDYIHFDWRRFPWSVKPIYLRL